MAYPGLVARLIEALRCLPGVGPKSAQRMALHLLEKDRDRAEHLAHAILDATQHVKHCVQCRAMSDEDVCEICASPARDRSLLCVVEGPTDVNAIESSTGYKGLYFVLMGHLSPLDGIGPEELGIPMLLERLGDGEVEEVILATNPTVEGEATAHFLSELVHARGIRVTRIAHGVPLGGELEYTDSATLSHAFSGRREI